MNDEVYCSILINIEVFYKLILSFFIGLVRHAQNTETSLHYFNDISRKKLGIKFIFRLQGDMEVFDQLILSFLTRVARHPQSTQNNELTMS